VGPMSTGYGRINIEDAEDIAAKFGMGEVGEARYVRDDVGAEGVGLSWYRMNPGRRTGFGHRHDAVEELYVVLAGSGRVKLDEEIVEVRPMDSIRVAPSVARAFEAGPDGLELLAFGPRHPGDGELIQDFW
jgi:mannose-6-phosphate isomerase-like protein (cupin superfamily)